MIEIRDLNAYYGHIHALKDFSLEIETGSIVAVLGPNGAGKTTLVRSILGLRPPDISGEIIYKGRNIERFTPEHRVRLGISGSLEGKRIFPGLTVKDNLLIGSYLIRKNQRKLKENLEFVFELFPVLGKKASDKAQLLSGGEQQMLSIGRALMSNPDFLLLDEPSFGLAPKVVKEIFRILKKLNEENNLTILLVEQDAALALDFSDRALLVAAGRTRLEGLSEELKKDNRLINIYLGGKHR